MATPDSEILKELIGSLMLLWAVGYALGLVYRAIRQFMEHLK